MMHSKFNTNTRHGGTLTEVVIAALVTGVLLVPVLRMLGYTATSYSKQSVRDQACLLALDLMSEITLQEFEDTNTSYSLGPETGENSRADYDDVDDYHGLDETPPKNADGTDISGATGFRRVVQVNDGTSSYGLSSYSSMSSSSTLKHITVQVYFNNDLIHTIESVVGKYGLRHNTEGLEGDTPKAIQSTIQFDSQSDSISSSVNLLNQVPKDIHE